MAQLSDSANRDAAADASQLLARVGYVALALAAPSALALSSRAIFLLFPIGVALLLVAAALGPTGGVFARLRWAFAAPAGLAGLALFAWAALSLLWSPFPSAGAQLLLKIGATALATTFVVASGREHVRATDLYLFPIGVALTMATILCVWLGARHGLAVDAGRVEVGGVAMVVMLYPALGGLAARGRNGYARALMMLALAYVFAIGSAATAAALLVGFAVLGFGIADIRRTARELSWLGAGLTATFPLVLAIASAATRFAVNAKLASLPPPYSTLAAATKLVLHDKARLITGHGLAAVARGVEAGWLPAEAPRSAAVEIWYDLGVVGALAAAAAIWLGFRAVSGVAPRFAPYLAAALACDVTFAFLSESFADMTWMTLLAISAVALGAAARSQYRTTRPSAAHLAQL